MNKFLVEMGSELDVDQDLISFFKTNKRCGVFINFEFKAITEGNDVTWAMNAIKCSAMGTNYVSIQMIKGVSPYVIKAVTHLMNESLRLGNFPNS